MDRARLQPGCCCPAPQGSIHLDRDSYLDRPSEPGSEDRFRKDRWFFSRLDFQRGEDGDVTGFRLQGERVQNLLFERR